MDGSKPHTPRHRYPTRASRAGSQSANTDTEGLAQIEAQARAKRTAARRAKRECQRARERIGVKTSPGSTTDTTQYTSDGGLSGVESLYAEQADTTAVNAEQNEQLRAVGVEDLQPPSSEPSAVFDTRPKERRDAECKDEERAQAFAALCARDDAVKTKIQNMCLSSTLSEMDVDEPMPTDDAWPPNPGFGGDTDAGSEPAPAEMEVTNQRVREFRNDEYVRSGLIEPPRDWRAPPMPPAGEPTRTTVNIGTASGGVHSNTTQEPVQSTSDAPDAATSEAAKAQQIHSTPTAEGTGARDRLSQRPGSIRPHVDINNDDKQKLEFVPLTEENVPPEMNTPARPVIFVSGPSNEDLYSRLQAFCYEKGVIVDKNGGPANLVVDYARVLVGEAMRDAEDDNREVVIAYERKNEQQARELATVVEEKADVVRQLNLLKTEARKLVQDLKGQVIAADADKTEVDRQLTDALKENLALEKRLAEQKRAAELELERVQGMYKNKARALDKAKAEHGQVVNELQGQLTKVKGECKSTYKELARLKTDWDTISCTSSFRDANSDRFREENEALVERFQSNVIALEDVTDASNAVQQKYRALRKELATSKTRMDHMDEQSREYRKTIRDAQYNIQDLQQQLDKVKAELERLTPLMHSATPTEQQKSISALTTRCDIFARERADLKQQISKLTKQIRDSDVGALAALKERYENALGEIEKWQAAYHDLKSGNERTTPLYKQLQTKFEVPRPESVLNNTSEGTTVALADAQSIAPSLVAATAGVNIESVPKLQQNGLPPVYTARNPLSKYEDLFKLPSSEIVELKGEATVKLPKTLPPPDLIFNSGENPWAWIRRLQLHLALFVRNSCSDLQIKAAVVYEARTTMYQYLDKLSKPTFEMWLMELGDRPRDIYKLAEYLTSGDTVKFAKVVPLNTIMQRNTESVGEFIARVTEQATLNFGDAGSIDEMKIEVGKTLVGNCLQRYRVTLLQTLKGAKDGPLENESPTQYLTMIKQQLNRAQESDPNCNPNARQALHQALISGQVNAGSGEENATARTNWTGVGRAQGMAGNCGSWQGGFRGGIAPGSNNWPLNQNYQTMPEQQQAQQLAAHITGAGALQGQQNPQPPAHLQPQAQIQNQPNLSIYNRYPQPIPAADGTDIRDACTNCFQAGHILDVCPLPKRNISCLRCGRTIDVVKHTAARCRMSPLRFGNGMQWFPISTAMLRWDTARRTAYPRHAQNINQRPPQNQAQSAPVQQFVPVEQGYPLEDQGQDPAVAEGWIQPLFPGQHMAQPLNFYEEMGQNQQQDAGFSQHCNGAVYQV